MMGRDNGLEQDVSLLREYGEEIKGDLYRPAAGLLSLPYLSAGIGDTYPDLTDWDAVWAGAAYLMEGDPEPLRNSLLNLIEHVQPDGKGQRRIGVDRYSAPPFQIRPFLATGCFGLSRETNDVDWLGREGLEKLERYLLYRHEHRTGREGLIKWLHVDEGFGDNGLANWAWEPNSVEGTDLNAQMVLEHSATAWLAEKMGDGVRVDRHRHLARLLHRRLETFLWNEEAGFYFSLYNPAERYRRSKPIRCLQYTNLWPLWLGLAREDRARRVIEEYVLSKEHFWGPYGVRSMAISERHFHNARRGITQPLSEQGALGPTIETSNSSNIQGPVWPMVNYLVALGLARYGYREQATELAEKMVRLFAWSVREHGCFYENHHSETGEPLAAPGIGSWCLMVHHLPEDVAAPQSWWLKGLALPGTRERGD
jgi:hypothetical protein